MNSSTSLCRQVCPHRCFDPRTQPVARVPPAHPQLSLPGHRPQTSGWSASSPFRRCRTILPAGSPHLPLSAQPFRGFVRFHASFPSVPVRRRDSLTREPHRQPNGEFAESPCSISSPTVGMGEKRGRERLQAGQIWTEGSAIVLKRNTSSASIERNRNNLKLSTIPLRGLTSACRATGRPAGMNTRGWQVGIPSWAESRPLFAEMPRPTEPIVFVLRLTAAARSTPSWRAPGSAGRCNRDRWAERLRRP
jgi:hypothetical protein